MATLQQQISVVLDRLLAERGLRLAFVCTEGGLLVAGEGGTFQDDVASLVGLMDVIVQRAARDLQLTAIDEVTLLDRSAGRLVVRPIVSGDAARLFLVISVDTDASWRRSTNLAVRQLGALLASVAGAAR